MLPAIPPTGLIDQTNSHSMAASTLPSFSIYSSLIFLFSIHILLTSVHSILLTAKSWHSTACRLVSRWYLNLKWIIR
jgi:hypothetical protein